MKNLYFYALVAFLTFFVFTSVSYSQKYGMFTEFIGTKSQLTEFFVPGGPHTSQPYKVIIAFHPYNTPPEAIREMVLPSAEKYNAILACPNVHPDYSGDVSEDILTFLDENYNLEDKNVVLTGYSAGGNAMFDYGLPNNAKIKGLIGIAPSPNLTQSDYQYLDKLPIGIIIGTSDHLYDAAKNIEKEVKERGGSIHMIEKSGVGHTGQYFWSPEFNDDWNECYDFIQSWLPKVNPITLLEPENNSENLEPQISFLWDENELASSYKIQISEDVSFSKITEEENLSGVVYQSKNIENGKTYYWRVCGVNSSGDGLWSNTWSFSTMPLVPDMPDLLNPKNNATDVEFPIELHWNRVENAEKYTVRLWDTENEEPISVTEVQEMGKESYVQEVDCEPATEYKWQVEAENIAGSTTSQKWSFFTLALPSSAPELLFPEDGSYDQDLDIEFRWKAIDDADSYEFKLYEEETDNLLIHENGITTSSQLVKYEYPYTLEEGIDHYWEVCGINSAGPGPWTEKHFFQTVVLTSVIDEDNTYSSYPNPFNNSVTIEFDSESIGKAYITVMDHTGKKIHSQRMNTVMGKNIFTWLPENLNSGLYFYSISLANQKHITGKLVYVK